MARSSRRRRSRFQLLTTMQLGSGCRRLTTREETSPGSTRHCRRRFSKCCNRPLNFTVYYYIVIYFMILAPQSSRAVSSRILLLPHPFTLHVMFTCYCSVFSILQTLCSFGSLFARAILHFQHLTDSLQKNPGVGTHQVRFAHRAHQGSSATPCLTAASRSLYV
jgi:hypothetical protein